MTRSIRGHRGRLLLAGTVVATALLASGCGAGQIAETANFTPGVPGVSATTPDGRFKIVNLAIAYPGPGGYPAGADAPLNLAIHNDTLEPATVEISTTDARAVVLDSASASPTAPTSSQTAPAGTLSPTDPAASPGATATPATGATTDPAGTTPPAPAVPTGPARVEVPPSGIVLLNGVTAGPQLRLVGLGRALTVGEAVTVVFNFGGQRLELPARVAIPRTPLPRTTASDSGQHG